MVNLRMLKSWVCLSSRVRTSLEATTRTILMPDADSMYAEAVKNIAEGIAKYNVQEELDLGGIET